MKKLLVPAVAALLVFSVVPVVMASQPNIVVDEAPAPVARLTAQDRRDLQRIEGYFNSLKPLEATFTQRATGLDGSVGQVSGNLKLWRPGRLRIQYDAPSKDFIVADGANIYHWDDQMKQQSQTGIDSTLAGFLLKRDLDFEGEDVTVVRVEHPVPQQMEVTLRSVKDPQAGEMTLVVQESPMQLLGWRVLDAQGVVTQVKLSNIKADQTFRRSDFVFRNPNFGNNRNNR